MFNKTLIVQYSGDFLEAYTNMQADGPEYYAYQRYSLQAVESVADKVEEIASLCCFCSKPYNVALKPGLRAIGLGLTDDLYGKALFQALIDAIKLYQPDLIVFRTPLQKVIAWANRNAIPVCTLLADSFSYNKLQDRYHHYVLAKTLNHKNVTWVSNHALNASRSLQKIGVQADKIVPWDWPAPKQQTPLAPKQLPLKPTYSLMYVGGLSEAKGVLDCIRAVQAFNQTYRAKLRLDIYGKGEDALCASLITSLGLQDHVLLKGLLPNSEVLVAMRNADIVLIPSRHEYPEGIPKTIGEALRSKTPIIASDHPMFSSKLKSGSNCLTFPSADVKGLVASIHKLINNSDLYHHLSESKDTGAANHQFIEWGSMLEAFVMGSLDSQALLKSHSVEKLAHPD